MCGIVALCGAAKNEGLLIANRMADFINHRGPDSKGDAFIEYPQVPEGGPGVAFAHRRLAILDVTSAGRQPMFSHSGRLCICYNGEIYNHHDLRQKYLHATK